ncbi:hypothetical protein H6504_04215 [Candidatus Woesearchaeota archaeon]|nr:hypothetical protein [Candidatus Woesearchaeota archaeon]
MIHKTKSVIIGRKKKEHDTDEDRPCFVSLFDVNKPHTSGKVPTDILEFPHSHRVIIKGLDVSYLLMGNDLVIENLEEIEVEYAEGHIYLTGVQQHSDETE